jgi:hypothetical protein
MELYVVKLNLSVHTVDAQSNTYTVYITVNSFCYQSGQSLASIASWHRPMQLSTTTNDHNGSAKRKKGTLTKEKQHRPHH